MRIVRFSDAGRSGYGILDGDRIKGIEGMPWENLELSGEEFCLGEVRLLAPVDPPDIFAVGLNYRAHADEGWEEYPAEPLIFLKATSSVIGQRDDIILPSIASEEVDFEAELAIVIGRRCGRVGEEEALDFVLGYTCGNDVSARDCQLKKDRQWARGKSFDTFCPLGPWIETELDPGDLRITSRLNGKTMQDATTADMLFGCAKIVSFCSQFATMRPGTIIMTGTPAGVGFVRQPPLFLAPGDLIEVEIEGIGVLSNRVSAEV